MVDFNPAEIRGFHGRWIFGGEHHKHVRNAIRKIERGAADTITRDEKTALRRHQILQDRMAVETAGREARSAGISREELHKAMAQYGVARQEQLQARKEALHQSITEETRRRDAARDASRAADREQRNKDFAERDKARREERAASDKKREEERKKRDKQRRQQRRRGGLGRGLLGAGRALGGAARLGMGLARLGIYLHSHKKAAAKAKAKAKKKAPARKKTAVRKAAHKVAAQRRIAAPKPPKGLTAHPAKGGRAQVAKPSAAVMKQLATYVATK